MVKHKIQENQYKEKVYEKMLAKEYADDPEGLKDLCLNQGQYLRIKRIINKLKE